MLCFYKRVYTLSAKIGKGCLRPIGERGRRQEVKGGVLLTSLVVYDPNMDNL